MVLIRMQPHGDEQDAAGTMLRENAAGIVADLQRVFGVNVPVIVSSDFLRNYLQFNFLLNRDAYRAIFFTIDDIK